MANRKFWPKKFIAFAHQDEGIDYDAIERKIAIIQYYMSINNQIMVNLFEFFQFLRKFILIRIQSLKIVNMVKLTVTIGTFKYIWP